MSCDDLVAQCVRIAEKAPGAKTQAFIGRIGGAVARPRSDRTNYANAVCEKLLSMVEEGSDEAGSDEAGSVEAGSVEAGSVEAGSVEAGSDEAGSVEDGSDEAGSVEAGSVEAGSVEAGSDEAGSVEAGSVEAGSGLMSHEYCCAKILRVVSLVLDLSFPARLLIPSVRDSVFHFLPNQKALR